MYLEVLGLGSSGTVTGVHPPGTWRYHVPGLGSSGTATGVHPGAWRCWDWAAVVLLQRSTQVPGGTGFG